MLRKQIRRGLRNVVLLCLRLLVQVVFKVDGVHHFVSTIGRAVGVGVVGQLVHVHPVIVSQLVHVVFVVLVRDLFVGYVGCGLVKMVVSISCGGHRGHGGRGGSARGWHLLLHRTISRRLRHRRGWTRGESSLHEQVCMEGAEVEW